MGCGGSKAVEEPKPVEYDWEALDKKLPTEKEQRDERIKIWTEVLGCTAKGNCPLATLEEKLTAHLSLPEEMVTKGPMKKAYDAAKDKYKGKNDASADNELQWNEFRIFLIFLRQYFEYYQMFKSLDTSGDMKVSLEEFKKALSILKDWGVEIKEEDAETEFAQIDKDGGGKGSVDFDEFCAYAIKKALDCDNDPDDDAIEMLQEGA